MSKIRATVKLADKIKIKVTPEKDVARVTPNINTSVETIRHYQDLDGGTF